MADNNGDGQVSFPDGVDLNRNLPDHWGYTPEGASNDPYTPVYRGPAPASEPETKALVALGERVRFRFIVNYHSYGQLVLYPIGWQEQTPTADQAIYAALAGTPVNPAIPGYKPELSTDLYPTDGETASWAHADTGTLAFTVELGEGVPGSGFLFPDNEALIEQEYQLNRPFALDVAHSASDPARPVSHLGNRVPSFSVDSFAVSYGDPQPVQATVLRRLGPVEVHWQVGGGQEQQAPAIEWAGGLRYGGTGDVWAQRVRGSVTGTKPGDTVKVWFTASGEQSEAFTYRVAPHRGAKVLVVVGGDHQRRIGALPTPAASPAPTEGLATVLTALEANGVEADTYDVEAFGHVAPDHLGVLGHYGTVVWTADEEPRTNSPAAVAVPLAVPGPDPHPIPESVSRLANEEMLAARDYLNEGGRLLYMGRNAARPYIEGAQYDPVADGPCMPETPVLGEVLIDTDVSNGCVSLSDDFFQFWLGAYQAVPGGGSGPGSGIAPVDGVRAPFNGVSWTFADPGIARGQNSVSFAATADALGNSYRHLPGVTAARFRGGRNTAAGAAVETPSSILFGFGLEDIATPAERATVMGRALSFLLSR
jgi:hypothetical protein